MSDTTKIEWTDYSWSPWEGCTKVSPGCLNCYAEARDKRMLIEPVIHWGKGAPRRRTKDWTKPVKWNRQAGQWPLLCPTCHSKGQVHAMTCSLCETVRIPNRPRVFPSVMDWLDDEVPIEWLADFLKLIRDTPNLDWLLLTKRTENWIYQMARALDCIGKREGFPKEGKPSAFGNAMVAWVQGQPPANVWIGTSVEDQTRADERIPQLRKIPAAVRFLSVEPLLGPVDLSHWLIEGGGGGIDWVIIGGESGHVARPCNVEWVRSIVRQCKAASVPCFVKQLGANVVDRNDAGFDGDDGEWPMDTRSIELDPMAYQGAPVRVQVRHPKGGEPAEWPEDLRVREFPKPPA